MTAVLTRTDVVARAKALKAVPDWAPILGILSHWSQIIAAMTIFFLYPTWWLYIPLLLFISARQYGLAIILHDAQHSLLHSNKSVSNWLGTWLLAAPLGTGFATSQKSHLDHHFNFGSPDNDPDYALYCFGQPSPKQSTWRVAALFIGKLMGGKIGEMLRKSDAMASTGKGAKVAGEASGLITRLFRLAQRLWTVICIHLVLLMALTWAFGWWGYLGLWALPLATFAAFYNDFRIFCEHSLVGRDAADKDERLTSFISNPLERFFFAPNYMNYHAEHHMFPYVPHQNLPALREAVRACPELNGRIAWRPSYFGHFIAYIRGLKRLQLQDDPLINRISARIGQV
jgi:fatty acid desaturase